MSVSRPMDLGDASGNKRVVLGTAILAVLLVAVPVGVSLAMRWVDLPWDASPKVAKPDWVSVPTLRATTSDGTSVKARVALDVQDSSAKSRLQREPQQLGLLLETSIAGQTRAQLGSPEGIQALSREMRTRVNGYLGEGDAPAVRAVVIQDLLVNPQ